MADVEIIFEPDKQTGLVAVGTYILDAAERLGVQVPAECGRLGKCHSCKVKILSGVELLSEPTKMEIQHLTLEKVRSEGERLACQTKIVKSGEVIVMTFEQKKEEPKETSFEKFRKEFYDMPLDKKVAYLVELEAITLGETLAFVLNSPFKIFDALIDAMAEFGLKLERQEKEMKTPTEHREEKKSNHETSVDSETAEQTGEEAKQEVENTEGSNPISEDSKIVNERKAE
ncbi:MAG: 2Fe-2S iron-sulfur cluster-binding protein [Pyrinomonadaceae bacterium]